jgi:hypothetical protein
MNCADLEEDSCPGRISDPVLAPSRHASQASCHRGTQRPSISHTKRNPTCAPAMGQDYPLTRPSPGANRPIYPSFPALASRSLPEGRIPKSHESFFFFLTKLEGGTTRTHNSRARKKSFTMPSLLDWTTLNLSGNKTNKFLRHYDYSFHFNHK